jgi:hypothetical protein
VFGALVAIGFDVCRSAAVVVCGFCGKAGTRYGGVRIDSVKDLLGRTLGKFGLKKQAGQWKIVESWPRIVGESLAKVSRPKYVIAGVLYVGTSSSSWANELDCRKTQILSLIKEHLGETSIREIRFQSSSWKHDAKLREPNAPKLSVAEKERVAQLSAEIENSGLKKIFERILSKAISGTGFKG